MQEYSSFWCVICIIAPTLAKICLPSYHRLIRNNQTYTFFNRKDFQPDIISGEYSLPMVLDRSRLIVGAKDVIYFLNDVTLKVNTTYSWPSDKTKLSNCKARNIKDSCFNYIHFMAIHKNSSRLMICGTNSLSPKYKLISLNTFETIKEKNDKVCSSHRSISMVGEITDQGEFIAGNYKYFQAQGNNPVVGTFPLISGYIIDNPKILRKSLIADKKFQVNQPEFIASASVGNSVYIFMMEKAAENNDINTATVVRLCTTDSGGSRLISMIMWTTLRKTRLVCKIKDKENQQTFNFQNLVDVVYDKFRDVFYASFKMFKVGNMHSAVCTFRRLEINNTFDGNFLKTSTLDDKVSPVDNGNFLFGCKVNPLNLSRSNPNSIGGKEPTNFLKKKALSIAKQYALMEHKVYNHGDEFEFMQSMTSFSRLALDQVGRTNANSPVLFIGTESGSVLLVYKNKRLKPCIVEEILTDIGEMKNMLFNEDKRILYISSSSRVIALEIDNCSRYSTKGDCKQAHNPRCGWSRNSQQCIPSWNISDLSTIEQDLTNCANRSEFFRPWSQWSPCEHSEKKYCHCRQRSCDSCDTSLCKEGRYSEVKNCAVNKVSNVTRWWVEGSVDGIWSKWSKWGDKCHNSTQCGNNTMSIMRNCQSPENGGRECLGNNFKCKSCPKVPIVTKTLWSGWSSWGECLKTSEGYVTKRSRKCSKPDSCVGDKSSKSRCVPSGVAWGNWSICSCLQWVKHRYPLFINGCNNCTQLKLAQYGVCIPAHHECSTKIPTTTIKIIRGSVTTPESTTTKSIDTKSISTSTSSSPSSTSTGKGDDTTISSSSSSSTSTDKDDDTTISSTTNSKTIVTTKPDVKTTITSAAPVEPPIPSNRNCNPDNKYTLLELLITCFCIIIPCFLISALVIYFSRRKIHTNGHDSESYPLNNHKSNIA